MKRFIAQLSGGDFINIAADAMQIDDDAIIAIRNGHTVAYISIGMCLTAHLSERDPQPAKQEVHT